MDIDDPVKHSVSPETQKAREKCQEISKLLAKNKTVTLTTIKWYQVLGRIIKSDQQ